MDSSLPYECEEHDCLEEGPTQEVDSEDEPDISSINMPKNCESKHAVSSQKSNFHSNEQSDENGASGEDEPEWDDDSNPWLGCICGETHKSPMPVFWIQCDSCDAWYNCTSTCVGFSKKEALDKVDWECPDCAPFDKNTAPAANNRDRANNSMADVITPKKTSDFVDRGEGIPIPIGTVVEVEARTWSGSDKPGGVAKIIGFHEAEDDTLYDVQYVLGGTESNVESEYISQNNAMVIDFASTRSTRSSELN